MRGRRGCFVRRKDLQPHGQRPRLDRIGDDQRPQKIVPVMGHGDEAIGQIDRPREGHMDLHEDLEDLGALHPRSVVQFARNGSEGLAQQEDAEGRGRIGQRDARERGDLSQICPKPMKD